tara:strand:+ start:9192 stop:9527 length:336 start_codon:yes stop_codon:yes gene_type:complete
MDKNLDKKLAQYSKIKFDYDLNHFENDVKGRIFSGKRDGITATSLMEKWFGVPVSMGVSAIASTLIVGVFLGAQMDRVNRTSGYTKADKLGLGIFSEKNAQLPSTLLVSKK